MNPPKAKPGAGRRRASLDENVGTEATEPQDTARASLARILALLNMCCARELLSTCALAIDTNQPGIADVVEAADLLDAAIDKLAGAT